MDRKRFDALARVVGMPATRRITITALGAALLSLTETAESRKKRKSRRKRKRKGGDGSGEETVNLCCLYLCDPPSFKHYCNPNAKPGITACDASYEGCSFEQANYVDTCGDCPV